MKRYKIEDGVLRFTNSIFFLNSYIKIPDYVHTIDFNNVRFINKPLDLSNTGIRHLDFKGVIMVDKIILPPKAIVIENLYWAKEIVTNGSIVVSERLQFLNIIDEFKDTNLVYLSGTVSGFLDKREKQRELLLRCKLLGKLNSVYSPGHHMTFGDPVADENPDLVYDIDIKAMERANIFVFDLTNLSVGTCAELGYCIAKGWDKTKTLYAILPEEPIKNFYIRGLANKLKPIKLEELPVYE